VNMIVIEVLNKDYPASAVIEAMGYIPEFLDGRDPRPAKVQLHTNYSHGGGWFPFDGFTMNLSNHSLKYSGDPPYHPLAVIHMRDEDIYVYNHAWVAIVQKDGKYEVARMD